MKRINHFIPLILFILISSISTAQEKSTALQHVLLFDWKEQVEPAQREGILDLFRGLVAKVEGFEDLIIEDVTASSGPYDMVLILEFLSEGALAAYEEHPDHIKISEDAPPLLDGFLAFDFKGKF